MQNIEELIGRREASRRRVTIGATLLTSARHQKVVLQDLSSKGAKISLSRQVGEVPALLKWGERRAWGRIVWSEGLYAGMQFDHEVDGLD